MKNLNRLNVKKPTEIPQKNSSQTEKIFNLSDHRDEQIIRTSLGRLQVVKHVRHFS